MDAGVANAMELSESRKLGIYGAISGSDMRQKLDTAMRMCRVRI